MPRQFHKTIQDYLSKIKKPSTSQLKLPSKSLTSSTSWILRGCKHPKTPSFAIDSEKQNHHSSDTDDQDHDDGSATLSDIDKFLIENFRSLYDKDLDQNKDHDQENQGAFSYDSPKFDDLPCHDLCSSHRFFVAPASSGSVIDNSRTSLPLSDSARGSGPGTAIFDASSSPSECSDKKKMAAEDFIAVLRYSWSPCDDFKSSMQEMMEARLHQNGKVDWEFLEELLLCYLNLNDNKSHKYILSAFVDLIVLLRENSVKVQDSSDNVPARFPDMKQPQEEKRKGREM
ncbi:transcription repressor OFP14 [Apium graveolens]|uniref:transcription repressor OFP14 n=1 Tax=Apium graveolens TaxID=4045 RepID=UPI003D79989A